MTTALVSSPGLTRLKKTFVVGRRSWIASHLFDELQAQGKHPEYLHKAEVGDERLTGCTMFLIAGVARPTQEDMDREIDLCHRARSTGAKVIYLSSSAVDRWEAHSRVLSHEGELYVLGKKRCETIITGGPSGCGYALRAPVVFGPGQRLESDMLLPTIIRTQRQGLGTITLHEPFRPFEMVYVRDLVKILVTFGDQEESYPVVSLRTEPAITPIDLCALVAPGWSVYLPPGWVPYVPDRKDKDEIYHVPRSNVPFRREDVLSTVAWYDDETPQLIPPGTRLLEG